MYSTAGQFSFGPNHQLKYESIFIFCLQVSAEMRDILTHSKLISDASSSGSVPEITSAGFQYLLMDRTKQIWTYILKYFEFHKVKYGRDLTE